MEGHAFTSVKALTWQYFRNWAWMLYVRDKKMLITLKLVPQVGIFFSLLPFTCPSPMLPPLPKCWVICDFLCVKLDPLQCEFRIILKTKTVQQLLKVCCFVHKPNVSNFFRGGRRLNITRHLLHASALSDTELLRYWQTCPVDTQLVFFCWF